jgi:hypothetical protein
MKRRALRDLRILALPMIFLGLTSCAPVIQGISDSLPPKEMRLTMPEFRHKVVDAETGKPIEGVFVYGFARLYRGSYVGGQRASMDVRNFELMTDANGEFTLPAWERTVSFNGEPEQQFPHISMWKPGYQYTQYSGGSLYGFAPNLPEAVRSYYGGSWKDTGPATLDLRDRPTLLAPAKTLRERFLSYDASTLQGTPLLMPCGFNDYPRVLVAQHYEWKRLSDEIVPPHGRLPDGSIRADFKVDDSYIVALGYNRQTPVEALKNWRCPTGPASDLLKKIGSNGETLK